MCLFQLLHWVSKVLSCVACLGLPAMILKRQIACTSNSGWCVQQVCFVTISEKYPLVVFKWNGYIFESSITNTIKTSKGYESILKPLGIPVIFLPYYRVSFNKMSKVIWDCFWFVSLYFALWFVGKTCASINLNQSDFKLKLIVTWSLRCSHVILFFALIGCYYWLGFQFTTCN